MNQTGHRSVTMTYSQIRDGELDEFAMAVVVSGAVHQTVERETSMNVRCALLLRHLTLRPLTLVAIIRGEQARRSPAA